MAEQTPLEMLARRLREKLEQLPGEPSETEVRALVNREAVALDDKTRDALAARIIELGSTEEETLYSIHFVGGYVFWTYDRAAPAIVNPGRAPQMGLGPVQLPAYPGAVMPPVARRKLREGAARDLHINPAHVMYVLTHEPDEEN